MSSLVPEGWFFCPIGNHIEVLTDYTANGSFASLKENVQYFNEKNYAALVRTTDLEKNTFCPQRFTDKQGYEFLEKSSLKCGDIVIANVGSAGKAYRVPDANMPMTLAPNMYLVKFCKSMDNNFAFQVITNEKFYSDLMLNVGSSTLNAINKSNFRSISIFVPPLPEQKKIASILTSVDEVIENTQKQIDKLQDLKKATLNELLTKGIGHTEFKDSELGRIPKSWEVVSLDKVCKVRQGLQIPIRDRFKGAATGRYPYLTVSWINSKFDSDKAEFIANPNDSVVLKSNEFVVGRTGAVGQIFDGLECVFHNNFFAVSLLTDSVEKEFLKHFLKWHTTQDLLLRLAGSTTIPDLNHGDFYSINVGLPPVEEQCRVVSQVDSIDTTLREIRLKLNALMSLKKSLMQDLLTGKVRVTVN